MISVQADALLSYNGRAYRLAMHPLDGKKDGSGKDSFRGYTSKGVVRDFVLKLYGPKRGYEKNTPPRDTDSNELSDPSFGAFYGGTIALDLDLRSGGTGETNMIQGATVTMTFTPQGRLIDGSAAQTVVRTLTVQDESSVGYSLYFRDIPLGDYTATATLTKPDGTSYPLRLRVLGGDWQNSAAVVFEPWETISHVSTVTLFATR